MGAPDDPLARWRLEMICGSKELMKASMTWSPAAGLNVMSVERSGQAWTITLGRQQLSVCPGCGARSKSRHSTYWRTLCGTY